MNSENELPQTQVFSILKKTHSNAFLRLKVLTTKAALKHAERRTKIPHTELVQHHILWAGYQLLWVYFLGVIESWSIDGHNLDNDMQYCGP
jgi:hypothetical protein